MDSIWGPERNDETGKASFLLNGQPFYPFVYYENYRDVTPKLLTQLRSEGFNSIQIAIDTCDAGSEDLKQVLQLLNRQGIPTFVEINGWEFLKALRADLSLNMVTVDGKPVKHFPDYANPETRRQHLEKVRPGRTVSEAVRPSAGHRHLRRRLRCLSPSRR